MKGLLPKIKNELWPRMTRNNNYEEICELVLTAESVVINKELSEEKGITAVIAGINHHEHEQDRALIDQKREIEELRVQLESLKIFAQEETKIHTIAALDNHNTQKNFGRVENKTNHQRGEVRFEGQSQGRNNRYTRERSKSADSYSRRNHSHSRSRSRSPHPSRSNHQHSYRRQSNNQRNYASSQRQDRFRLNNNNNRNHNRNQNIPRRQQTPTNEWDTPNNDWETGPRNQEPNWQTNEPPRANNPNITCYNCQQKGHIARTCSRPRNRGRQ